MAAALDLTHLLLFGPAQWPPRRNATPPSTAHSMEIIKLMWQASLASHLTAALRLIDMDRP